MKILDECDAMFGLVLIVWIWGFVFRSRMKCDYKVFVLLE